jgi:hypothetical protein
VVLRIRFDCWECMLEKSPIIVAATVLMLAMEVPARAADPALCKQYARGALVQVRGGLASPRCGAGLQGTRWSTEFAVHYEWCLEAAQPAIAAEREARRTALKGCVDQ